MQLDISAATRIYKVLAYLAVSPDGIDDDERAVMNAFADRHGLDAAVRAQFGAGVAKEALEAPQGEAEQAAMIEAMIEVVAADGCLDHTEQEHLLVLAQDLSIPSAAVKPKLLERLMGG